MTWVRGSKKSRGFVGPKFPVGSKFLVGPKFLWGSKIPIIFQKEKSKIKIHRVIWYFLE